MLIDARSLPQGQTIEAQLCIVGAGAAGIAIARALANTDIAICLLESGGLEADAPTQDLYAGEVTNPHFFPLDVTRLRFFGGSTNHWQGYCRPLDAVDFERRAYIPHSGWPITRADLDPYYQRAQAICGLGAFRYDAPAWAGPARKPFRFLSDRIRTEVFQQAREVPRFGERYGGEVVAAPNITTYLNATVTEIETPPVPNQVSGLRGQVLDGPGFRVKAQAYVLATGGIENIRLMLNSDRVQETGIGNQNGNVGRYFMDHPHIWKSGKILFSRPYDEIDFYAFDEAATGPTLARGVFLPSPEVLHREELPNFEIGLIPAAAADISAGAGAMKVIVDEMRRGRLPDDLDGHLANVIADLDGVLTTVYDRLPIGKPSIYGTLYSCEIPPDPDSRITLLDARDALGQRRVRLDWRLPAVWDEHLRRGHAILGEELGRAGLGRLQVHPRDTPLNPVANYENGHHHMGATRMHADAKLGVVDADCRVHGMANLFIAGSSVFPTYGYANPTLTVVALALRMADHLKAALD